MQPVLEHATPSSLMPPKRALTRATRQMWTLVRCRRLRDARVLAASRTSLWPYTNSASPRGLAGSPQFGGCRTRCRPPHSNVCRRPCRRALARGAASPCTSHRTYTPLQLHPLTGTRRRLRALPGSRCRVDRARTCTHPRSAWITGLELTRAMRLRGGKPLRAGARMHGDRPVCALCCRCGASMRSALNPSASRPLMQAVRKRTANRRQKQH